MRLLLYRVSRWTGQSVVAANDENGSKKIRRLRLVSCARRSLPAEYAFKNWIDSRIDLRLSRGAER